MRFLFLVLLLSLVQQSYSQITVNCIAIVDDKPIKPFQLNGSYIGKVIIETKLDTVTMKLTAHKFIFADLHLRTNSGIKIELRLQEQSGDIKQLDSILPFMVKHLQYLKFKINKNSDCVKSIVWKFPVTIK